MKTTVAVIYGGRSGEHEISIRSAKAIMAALDRDRYDVVEYFIDQAGKWSPEPILPEPGAQPEIDVVFPVLHGTFGEDGTVQGLLELADLPYVGAAVLASAVSMDKEMMKRVCIERGLPVVEYVALARHELDVPRRSRKRFAFPVFVKPANLGSSVGISKVHIVPNWSRPCAWPPSSTARSSWSARIEGASWSARCWATTIRWLPCPARSCLPRSFTITKTNTCSTGRSSGCPPS